MTQLSMSEMTTYRWSFEEDVVHLAAAGIPAIGVWRQKLSDFGEQRGRELLNESGLKVSNLFWAGGFTGGDGRSLRDSIEDACEAVRIAADLHAGCLVVFTGGRAGHTHAHARRLVRDALSRVLPIAEEHGITLALKHMHDLCASEWTFLTSLDEAVALLDMFDTPYLQLAIDTYHVGLGGVSLGQLEAIARRVAIVHLGDGRPPIDREQNRCRLGDGIIPLREIIAALSSGGYDGFYDVELIGQDIEQTDYRALLDQTKVAFSQLMASQTA